MTAYLHDHDTDLTFVHLNQILNPSMSPYRKGMDESIASRNTVWFEAGKKLPVQILIIS